MPLISHSSSSSSSLSSSWTTAQRTQFTVDLPSPTLLALLQALGDAQVNLAAFVQQADPQNVQSNVFVFVVGYADPADSRNTSQVVTTLRILAERQIAYEQHLILESNFINFIGVPGSFSGAVRTLSESSGQRPRILRAYFGEEGTVWFDVGTSPQDLAAIDSLVRDFIIAGQQKQQQEENTSSYYGCLSLCLPGFY